MNEFQITPDQMEVFVATAEVGGIDADLPEVLEYAGHDSAMRLSRMAQSLIDFRNGIVCEGKVSPESVPIGLVSKSVTNLELEFRQETVEQITASHHESVQRYLMHPERFDRQLDLVLTPKLLVFTDLFPDRHRIIELGQIATDTPELRGLDSHERIQRLLELHPVRQQTKTQ